MMYVIESAAVEQDYVLRLNYSDGVTVLVDFAPVVAQGGVFAPMAEIEVFRRVRVGPRGRSLEWPGEVDFCADALRREGRVVGQRAA